MSIPIPIVSNTSVQKTEGIASSPPIPLILSNIFENPKKKPVQGRTANLSYSKYMENPSAIKKYRLDELKSIAKSYRLHITGTKPVLIQRIEGYFYHIKYATLIQRIFRGYIVRVSFSLRGQGYSDRSRCVNETDPCTLETMCEIPREYFFSYADEKNLIYGFNIISLIQLLKTTKKIENPYNREVLSKEIVKNIIRLYKLISIIFPCAESENDVVAPQINEQQIHSVTITHRHAEVQQNRMRINSANDARAIRAPIYEEIVNRLRIMREKNTQTRIIEMFMEIDQLGNYTQSAWFSNLDRREYVRLYRCLYDIWNYRAHLSYEMKRNICIIDDPFHNVFNEAMYYHDISLNRIRDACITVFENMIFTGIDDEHRKLGVLHALRALTLVSVPARHAMPWLYESIAY